MNRIQKKFGIIIIVVSLPIIFVLNQVLFYIMPSSMSEGEQVRWFATWSSSLSFAIVLMIVVLYHRYLKRKR